MDNGQHSLWKKEYNYVTSGKAHLILWNEEYNYSVSGNAQHSLWNEEYNHVAAVVEKNNTACGMKNTTM